MKKVLSVLLGIFMMMSLAPVKASALNENVSIDVAVSGEAKKGNEIVITLKLNNVERYYATQMEYRYNKEELEIVSMKAGSIHQSSESGRYEVNGENGEFFNEKGIAKYAFTFMGSYEGNKGSGDYMTIKAKVLKDHNLKVSMDNMMIKLVERTLDSNMIAMKYKFNGYGKDIEPEEGDGYPEPGEGGGNSGGDGSTEGSGSGTGNNGDGESSNTGDSNNEGQASGGEEGEKTDEAGDAADKNDDENKELASKGDGEASKGDSNKGESSSESDKSGSSKVLIIAGVVIIAAGIVGVFFINNKKKGKDDNIDM